MICTVSSLDNNGLTMGVFAGSARHLVLATFHAHGGALRSNIPFRVGSHSAHAQDI
jgi:hypothetical protein